MRMIKTLVDACRICGKKIGFEKKRGKENALFSTEFIKHADHFKNH